MYMCVCVRVATLPVSTIFILYFGTAPTVWYSLVFFFFIYILLNKWLDKTSMPFEDINHDFQNNRKTQETIQKLKITICI